MKCKLMLPDVERLTLERVAPKRLWRRVRHYVQAARAKDDMAGVRHVGVDETSVKRGRAYITVVHDLEAKRLLFAGPGRDHGTLEDFAGELRAHGGDSRLRPLPSCLLRSQFPRETA